MGIVSTDQANIDAHMSILCSISLLVSILGAGPEMFKKLEGGNQIRLQILFQKFFLFSFHLISPGCIGCQSIFEPGGDGSPVLCWRMSF